MKKTLLALTLGLSIFAPFAALPALADEEDGVTRRTTEIKDGKEYICEYRRRTGTNLISKDCMTKEDAEAAEQAAREGMTKAFESTVDPRSGGN